MNTKNSRNNHKPISPMLISSPRMSFERSMQPESPLTLLVAIMLIAPLAIIKQINILLGVNVDLPGLHALISQIASYVTPIGQLIGFGILLSKGVPYVKGWFADRKQKKQIEAIRRRTSVRRFRH